MKRDRKRVFQSEGIRFECLGCGRCCRSHGDCGYVYVTEQDSRRLAAELGISVREFKRRYTRSAESLRYLRDPHRDCIFLEKTGCSVYAARPLQCRTWPFWPENLSEKNWSSRVASTCPGAGTGKLYSPEEIDAVAWSMSAGEEPEDMDENRNKEG